MRTSAILLAIFTCCGAMMASAQIANNYPNDIGIQGNPLVIHTDMFEQTALSTLLGAYNTSSVQTNFGFDASVPPGSTGTQSVRMATIESGSGTQPNEDTYLFKRFAPGVVGDSIFVRYYVKYNNAHTSHHSGVWMGGNNPPTAWPNCHAGHLPAGDQAFHVGSEFRGNVTTSSQNTTPFGFYNYWMNMHQSTQFDSSVMDYYYWGNEFISPDPDAVVDLSEWNCLEIMVKMNNPVTGSSGQVAMWINGVQVGYYGAGFPNGNWNQNFVENIGGLPFPGFQWRDDIALELNYVWLKNYSTNKANYTSPNDMLFDHLVVAKSYIGPISLPAGLSEKPKTNLRVYPNPANTVVRFSAPVAGYELRDVSGNLVKTTTESVTEFDLSEVSTGIYFLKTEGNIYKIAVNR